MSHEIESIAWSNEVPWHGLGVQVPSDLSVAKMLAAAGLNWTVSLREMAFYNKRPSDLSDELMPTIDGAVGRDFRALVRDSDSKVLDVVGSQYTPTQNRDAFEFFTEFVEAGSAKMETMGSLFGGRITWGLASLQQSFSLKGKDEVKGYLLLVSPHQQGKALMGMTTSVRVVCNNTLQAALGAGGTQNKFTFRHVKEFDKAAQEEAKVKMGIARDQFSDLETLAKQLQAIRLTDEQVLKIVQSVVDPDLAETDYIDNPEKLTKVPGDIYRSVTFSPGANLASAKGTGWGLVNGVTYAVDHLLRRNQDRRLKDAWFGKGATLKRRAVDAVLATAA